MKSVRWLFLIALTMTLAIAVAYAGDSDPQTPAPIQHGPRFVDVDGDGFNDLAPDHDNDGIPNGQDPDWTRPADGTGSQHAWKGRGEGRHQGLRGQLGFVDADGDGVCDNAKLRARRDGFGPGSRGEGLGGMHRRGANGTGNGAGGPR